MKYIKVTKSVTLLVAVTYICAAVMLAVPRTAEAMASYLPGVITTNHPGSKLANLCANCHTDWNGGGPGTSMRIDYLLYTSAGGAIPVLGNPYYMVDADNDGASTGTEFTNSQSASRPPLPNKWFPAYPDKDGDGCLQLIHRLTEKGALDVPSNVASNGYLNGGNGFITYVPQGWDVDDNDNTQGCSTPWPTSSNAGTFNNPGTTSDVTAPAAITDFRANGLLSAAIPLVWTATGDDGTTGAAHDYDLKYTTATLAAASLKCGAGTSPCNVRDPAHWAQMYNFAESGDALTPGWNMGNTAAPLMRALYEPLPSAPGATQTCNASGQNCTASPGASYILSSKGTGGAAIPPTNIITNGTTYWLALRTSDGVTRPSGTLTAPGAITENASLSNIIAVTAGAAGTGAAITSISPRTITGGQALNVTISASGYGLSSPTVTNMSITNSTGTVLLAATGTNLTYPTSTTVAGSFSCSSLLTLPAGTYNLELRNGTGTANVKAAWVNAITINNIWCPDAPSIVRSVVPSSRGQGAINQTISIDGSGFAGATAVSFGAGVTVNSFVVSSDTFITANITVAATATVGTRSVTVTTGFGTSAPNTLFSVIAAPVITNTPPGGSYGVAYSHQMTASGGSGSNVWSATGLPTGLSISTGGLITGTPNMVGTFVGSVTVTDINGGTDTDPISIIISATVPGAPIIGTAIKGNASATVTFTPPANHGGAAILNYTATASPGGITGSCMASPCTVTGLTNGTAYTFTVTATNSAGTGPASSASNSVTPSTVPGQVSPQPTTIAGNATCTVNFTAPNNGGATITSYTATASPGGITATSSGNPAAPSILVTGLTANTNYTFTVYATNLNGNGPASVASTTCFTEVLIVPPSLSSPTATVTGSTTATLGATITSNGGSAITARGTCWGTSTAPTTNCLAEGGNSVGTFTQVRTGLPAGTLIYYRGYATNSSGTGYSATGTFTTPSGLNVVLCPVTNITSTSATLCANILSDGGMTITARGFCLGTTPSPATNCQAEGGTTAGVFTQNRTGLTAGTTYFYRAFVTSPTGTGYTVDGTFTTLPVASDVDLVMTAVSTTSASVGAGHSFVIDNTEANIGTTNMTAANNTVKFYLSIDAVIATSDIVLTGTRVVPALAAGASSSAATTVTVPTSVVPGVYYIGVIADATNVVVETNETNNALAGGTITVIRVVDLVMTVVSTTAASAAPGDSFMVDNTELNQGSTNMTAADNTVMFYLSVDNMISVADTVLGSRIVPALAAGASSSASTMVTVSSTMAPGVYYVGACADATYVQPETNEANNCRSAGTTITIDASNTAPTVPIGLTASAFSSTQINLGWTASTDNVGVTGYRVYRNGVQVGTVTGTNYSDTGLTALTSYSYTVSACDGAGNCSAQSAAATATTMEGVPPTVPTKLMASAFSTTQINLSWRASTDNVGVTGYKVYRNGVQVGAPTGTSYSDTGLTAATSYSYAVSACDAAGNCSAQSSAVTGTTRRK